MDELHNILHAEGEVSEPTSTGTSQGLGEPATAHPGEPDVSNARVRERKQFLCGLMESFFIPHAEKLHGTAPRANGHWTHEPFAKVWKAELQVLGVHLCACG